MNCKVCEKYIPEYNDLETFYVWCVNCFFNLKDELRCFEPNVDYWTIYKDAYMVIIPMETGNRIVSNLEKVRMLPHIQKAVARVKVNQNAIAQEEIKTEPEIEKNNINVICNKHYYGFGNCSCSKR